MKSVINVDQNLQLRFHIQIILLYNFSTSFQYMKLNITFNKTKIIQRSLTDINKII